MPKTDLLRFAIAAATLAAGASAFALSTDRQQQMLIDANYQKTTQSQTGNADDPDITHLDGNVVVTQGSIKAHGDHATIYKNPNTVTDSNGNSGSLTRVILIGKPAHMQQLHDGDCGLMTGDAEKIDYHNDTGIAILTTHVIVVQKGKGEFHGENMIYNTNTGEMESGDKTPESRVHMVVEPHGEQASTPPTTNNCGFPGTPTPKNKSAKPAKTAAAAQPDEHN
jgi:lipopolysaccharide export system protein LptA